MKSKIKSVRVLIGTRHHAVPAALAGHEHLRIETVEAVSTEGVYTGLPGCALAVIDLDDLVLSTTVSREMLAGALIKSGIPVASGVEFADQPTTWFAQAAASSGLIDALLPQVLMLTGYSGGVGKSTLSLNLARYVSSTLRLPTAVIEINFGVGALHALADPELPDWYDVLTQGREIAQWEGMSVLPMDYAASRLLLSREEEIANLVRRVSSSHVLTVIDAMGANPIRSIVMPVVNRCLVVTDPRVDAVLNAGAMLRDLSGSAQVVLNKVGGVGEQIALAGVKAACRLPLVTRPLDDPRLAEGLLQVVYPGWKPQIRSSNTLFKKGK